MGHWNMGKNHLDRHGQGWEFWACISPWTSYVGRDRISPLSEGTSLIPSKIFLITVSEMLNNTGLSFIKVGLPTNATAVYPS